MVYLSPQGRRLDQAKVRELAALPRLALLCGRYEGIDERLVQAEVDEELSIGDYVLSGGELAAAVVVDAVARLQEGVLNVAFRLADEEGLPVLDLKDLQALLVFVAAPLMVSLPSPSTITL